MEIKSKMRHFFPVPLKDSPREAGVAIVKIASQKYRTGNGETSKFILHKHTHTRTLGVEKNKRI